MSKTKSCVIYDKSFGGGSGYGVALCDRDDVARQAKAELEREGHRARLENEHDGSERLWYLDTDAPFETLWSVLNGYLDAYLRFELLPGERMRVSDSFGGEKVHSLKVYTMPEL
jgi:hypothetical protein